MKKAMDHATWEGGVSVLDRGKRLQNAVNDRVISQLFQAYFNNKMTLLLFLIQAKTVKPSPHTLEGIAQFMDDLFHHMLTHEIQMEYQHAFEWLKSFFQILPEVTPQQRDQAKGFIRDIYQAMGFRFKVAL